MAIYSPGSRSLLPSGLAVGLPMWKSFNELISGSLPPVTNEASLGPNRAGEQLAAASFNGSNQLLSYEITTGIIQRPVSIAFWFILQSDGTDMVFLVKRVSTTPGEISLGIGTNNASPARLRVRVNTFSENPLIIGSVDLDLDTWYHCMVVIANTSVDVYQDNVNVGSASITDDLREDDGLLNLGYLESPELDLDGALSDVYIFDHALSTAERSQVYAFYIARKGSSGASTFQRSGQSFAIRRRRIPRNIRTQRSSQSRNRFTHVQTNYQNLSVSQKAGWQSQAPSFPRTNSLGLVYTPRGFNLFSGQNQNLTVNGLSLNPDASSPVTPPVNTPPAFTPNVSSSQVLLDAATATVPADWLYIYELTAPQSPGVDVSENDEFFPIVTVSAGSSDSIDAYTEAIARFPFLNQKIGMKMGARLAMLSVPTGQLYRTGITTSTIS